MKMKELYKKNIEELNSDLIYWMKIHSNLRMQIKSGNLKQTHLLREYRRNIARIKTYLTNIKE